MKIAICDDNARIGRAVAGCVEEYLAQLELSEGCEIKTFSSGEELLNAGIRFDIAFLDIEMQGLNGLQVAKALLEENPDAIILIITAYPHYLDDVMELSLYRFITKPIEKEKLKKCLAAAVKKYLLHSKTLEIKTESGNFLVKTSDIIYVSIEGKKVDVHTAPFGTIRTNKPFDYWLEILDSCLFVQTHRSYIVNMRYIRSYTANSVTLICKDKKHEVYISKRRLSQFKKIFSSFLGGTKC